MCVRYCCLCVVDGNFVIVSVVCVFVLCVWCCMCVVDDVVVGPIVCVCLRVVVGSDLSLLFVCVVVCCCRR